MNRVGGMQTARIKRHQTTTVDPKLLLWVDASDASSLTLSGSNVTHWRDKSSSALIFRPGVQGAIATTNPTFDSGRTAVSFSNSSSTLSTSSQGLQLAATWTPAGPINEKTSYFVVQFTRSVSSGLKCLLRLNGATPYPTHAAFHQLHPNQATGEHSRDAFFQNGTTVTGFDLNYTRTLLATNGTKYVIVARSASQTGSQLFINGTQRASSTSGLISAANMSAATHNYNLVYIGAGSDNRCWDGFVHEIRVYNEYHSDTTRGSIQTELATKWGVTLA